ncbi:unnamed protein product [Mesocestoides corti]|uniref:Neurexin-4 n=1 Tax=Mesocestoides corti TaxID=53468 RepID=A0A158QTR3_MESCO|nr:unnamed protein product [Mesocestoides corti]
MTNRYLGIKNDQITASSWFSSQTRPFYGRLHISDEGAGAWVARNNDDKQWIQVDLLNRTVITSVATQGRQGAREWVQDYYIYYSDMDVPVQWTVVKDSLGEPQLFDGNTDDNSVKTVVFSHPIVARYIRLNPQRWHGLIALRMELFGCEYRPFTARFDGNTWIEMLLDRSGRETQTAVDHLKFRFRTSKVNGLILYGDDSQNDYFSVELYRARLQVSLNLGTYPWATGKTDNVVVAGSLLDDEQWHDVSIIRTEKNLNISVDGVSIWRNLSAIFLHMDMNRKLYIGGVPSFSNKRSVTVMENFVGCIEEFNFNGVQVIRDTLRSKPGLIMSEAVWSEVDWLDALGYPPRDPILWWGPPTTTQQLNISGFEIGGTGVLGQNCLPPTADPSVITFPRIEQSLVYIKVERGGETSKLTFSLDFRTFNKGGVLFYHTVDNDKNFVAFEMETVYGHLQVEVLLPGVNYITYTMPNNDSAAPNGTFADGLWHSVDFEITTNLVRTLVDGREYIAQQTFLEPLHFQKIFYIGGGRPQRFSFQGCMRRISVNAQEVLWSKLDPESRSDEIINGSCHITDRCSPNPCKHEAPCTQNGATFFCDCTNTGYSGAVCHQSEFFTSCSEVGLFYGQMSPQLRVTIDLDGSGVLDPFTHTDDGYILVDGFQAPGSYHRKLNYGRASRAALTELTRRAVYCEQSVAYRCWNAKLLAKPQGFGDGTELTWGWWVSRMGRPRYYWGGGVPGLKMCDCGVFDTCTGNSLTCNCDSDGSDAPPLVDTGLLTYKEDLPVWEVYLGDTGTLTDDKRSEYSIQELRCSGDLFFDNTVTFVKLDANLELPSIFAEYEFDMSFLFKTTIKDAVLMQNVGRKSGHFFELRIRSGIAFRFAFNVGNGLQVLEVTTAYWLNNNQWHVVRLERNRKESRLIIDTNPAKVLVEAQERSFLMFNFDQPLFVGTTQAFTDGYVGCLSNLLINGVVQDIRGIVERGEKTYGLRPGCQPKCDTKPCLNRGVCTEFYSHYFCECGLTPYRGFICGREVGGTFNNGPMVKIDLTHLRDNLGTLEEYITVGFKTKSKNGILMEMLGAGKTNYIIIRVNNNGGITIEFDVGFGRFEVTTNYIVDLANDQHHTVKAWRTNIGQVWHLQVDDYPEIVKDFSDILSETADTRLDKPQAIYLGRNESMPPNRGFDGCMYAAQWNNLFPIRMIFEDPKNPFVYVEPPNSVTENKCGFEEILPAPEPIEIRPPIPFPPNLTLIGRTEDLTQQRTIFGVVGSLLVLIMLALFIICCRNFTLKKGDYKTKEAKQGAGHVSTVDEALAAPDADLPDARTNKEWWL